MRDPASAQVREIPACLTADLRKEAAGSHDRASASSCSVPSLQMAWVQTPQRLERPVLRPGNAKPQNSDPSYFLLPLLSGPPQNLISRYSRIPGPQPCIPDRPQKTKRGMGDIWSTSCSMAEASSGPMTSALSVLAGGGARL